MTAKLILKKTSTGFYLWRNPLDKSQELLGATVPIMNDNGVDLRKYKLSLKNCQAIEHGYDLDELAEKEFPLDYDIPLFETLGITEKSHKSILIGMLQGTLQKGFQTAMELMSDKKFSEEDISKAIDFGVHVEAGNIDIDYKRYGTKENQFIQSLQQPNEIEVEIEMGQMRLNSDGVKIGFPDMKLPKLDSDGCLILKRVV